MSLSESCEGSSIKVAEGEVAEGKAVATVNISYIFQGCCAHSRATK